MDDIDPFKYGILTNKVESLEKKVDKLEAGMEQLLKLANQSQGGFWVAMGVAAFLSSIVTALIGWWIRTRL